MTKADLRVWADADALADAGVGLFRELAAEAIAERGRFCVALAGGSTPAKMYRKLADAELDWQKIHFFFGDERTVPPDDERSNFRMANEALFSQIDIPAENIHRWHAELDDPMAAAIDYNGRLRQFFFGEGDDTAGFPRFDLILLGLGDDCHTASLFPMTDALDEDRRFAVANWVPQMRECRLTLTLPVINHARTAAFYVAGDGKAEAVASVINAAVPTPKMPASLVRPAEGSLIWLLDEAAASRLA